MTWQSSRMSSSRSSISPIPFKSKKYLQSTPKSKPANPITTQTPDKLPAELPPRLRNRRVALSVKEVREIAQGNRDGPHRNQTEQIVKSARRQISTWPEESIGESHKPRNAAVEEGPARLPAKYETLGEFFDSLDSSIRLLKLKGSMSTFTNVSPKIECLTDRRFSHQHLAQLKYILPEAIEIKRVLMFDERTSCMKPDLHVTLNVDAIECNGNLKSESKNLHLRKVFRARLADFYKAHPEGDEVPEEMLPEPFNRSKQDLSSEITKAPTTSSHIETSADAHVGQNPNSSLPVETKPLERQQPAVASHFSRSFRRHFSQKITKCEAANANPNPPKICSQPSILQISQPCFDKISSSEEASASASSLTRMPFESTTDGEKFSAGVHTPCLPATPCKEINSTNYRDNSPKKIGSFQSTPAKLASPSSTLMSMTPALHPPKRCCMSPDDGTTSLADKLTRRPSRTRSLKFETPEKNVVHELNDIEDVSADDDDILNILPESLLQSIREKERKVQEERDPAISQAKKRRQMIACLPKLFNMIHFLFQSIKRTVITKEELIHKIIASHSDIVDRREVEEQLKLLLELVPEWISEKLATSGDLLFCINKLSSPETTRARLEQAK
uniref:CDT1 Geminin-binding domain-containing protein n=1 Tax=Manihot esculenta TaxID=3983 RepID=A0A2C9UU91_MANES